MPRKLYLQHLDSLKSNPEIEGVSHVRHGDDAEEFRFQVLLADDITKVDITGIVTPCKRFLTYFRNNKPY